MAAAGGEHSFVLSCELADVEAAAAKQAAEHVLLSLLETLNKRSTRTIDLFRKINTTGDGTASREEFLAGLKAFGFEPSREEFDIVMMKLDTDGSGEVTVKELSRALRAVEKKQRVAKRKAGEAKERKSKAQEAAALAALGRTAAEEETTAKQKNKQPLEALDADDEVLIKIIGMLNQRKVRMINLFRNFDSSGDGMLSVEEIRRGLFKLGMLRSEDEFQAVLRKVDRDGSGEVELKEFDDALRLVERKAHAEKRGHEVDTWEFPAHVARQKDPLFKPGLRYDWSCRVGASAYEAALSLADGLLGAESSTFSMGGSCTSRSRTTATQSWAGPETSTQTSALSAFLKPRGSSQMKKPWSSAARGPLDAALSSPPGHGHVFDQSVIRASRCAYAAPAALPPTPSSARTPRKTPAVLVGRFNLEPAALPSDGMRIKGSSALGALRRRQGDMAATGPDCGVKKFRNAPMLQSSVDQVVFNRDMDFSGGSKFDDEFIALFDGCVGLPSWHRARE
eukprot:TRINITY_DN112825_c0_g1_i1.p1 TRINITY_DN112825_c0_g1~~TRINITY_DN112825_c0_g1_i1.p1  ORF type:complete len:509 (+),score=123.51 TRINITY_DN112825_c0_g1_i1:52-1578(+)